MSLQTILDMFNKNRIDLALNSLKLYAFSNEITEEAQELCKKVALKLYEFGCHGMAIDICKMYNIPDYTDKLEHINEELDPEVNEINLRLINEIRKKNHIPERIEELRKRSKPGNNL